MSLERLGKHVDDVEILFDVIKGKDRFDSTSVDLPENSHKPKKIGVPKGLLTQGGIDKTVIENFNRRDEEIFSAWI